MDVSLPRAADLGVMVTMWSSTSSSYADERALCLFSAWRMRASQQSQPMVFASLLQSLSLTLSRPLSLDINLTPRFCTISMSFMVFLRVGAHTASEYSNIERHKLV